MVRFALRLRLGGCLIAVVAMNAVVLAPAPALAAKEDARKHYDQATAAFGLGRYADAAVEYEAAFRLRPDPALLYNCAQAYRLAGNQARALELYRNYVRLYGSYAANTNDARKHISDLTQQIAVENVPAVHPPTQMAPPPPSPPPPPPGPPPSGAPLAVASTSPRAAPPSSGTVSPFAPVSEPSPSADPEHDRGGRSLLRRPWFWGAVGAVVVAGTVAALLAAGGDKDPMATFGIVVAN